MNDTTANAMIEVLIVTAEGMMQELHSPDPEATRAVNELKSFIERCKNGNEDAYSLATELFEIGSKWGDCIV